MKKITTLLEKGKDGYGVSFEEITTVYSFGETVEEAKENAAEALAGYIKVLNNHGKPLPEALQGEYELIFKFDTSTILEYVTDWVTQKALANATGINVTQINHYATRRAKPRPQQREKIVSGLHKIGRELLSVS
ncbi:MAG: type II toxin-antitoxin system HicB family antitoxin [Prevotellaceae bacterium]|jgi:predicted RNase H-like HicB family nuclease|nr:type II toxin-antitoxin system HicB family antitoxin [Prevotellaceae bacterium]